MAQDQTNIPIYGPYTALFKTGGSETKSYTGLLESSFSFNMESKKGSKQLGDGTEVFFNEGHKLTIEVSLDELSETDLDSLEGCDNAVYTFDNGAVITVDAADADTTLSIFADVDNGKTKITLIKTGPASAANAIADLFAVT